MTATRFGLKAFAFTAILMAWVGTASVLADAGMRREALIAVAPFGLLYHVTSRRIDR